MSTLTPVVERLSLTPAEWAEAHHVCRATVYNMLSRGLLESFTIGRARRIPVNALPRTDESNGDAR